MSKTRLTSVMKKSIMSAIFKSAVEKAIDREAVKTAMRNQLQAFYQELYGHGELHTGWQALHKAGLVTAMQAVTTEDSLVGCSDSYRDFHQAFGSSDWRCLGETLNVRWYEADPHLVSLSLDANEFAYPHDLIKAAVIRLPNNPKLQLIAQTFHQQFRAQLEGLPAQFNALVGVNAVLKATNNVESLVDKLPQIKDLILTTVQKHQPAMLPSNVNADQVRNFLSGLAPIEEKAA